MRGGAAAELGVVIIHGMGDPDRDFAQPLVDGLSRLLGADAKAVAFEPCFWSDILQDGQDEIWRRLSTGSSPMRLGLLRKWVVGTLGDPTGYLSGYERGGIPVMHRVHRRFADSLARVEARLADPARAPVVVLAHSLGCVVVTNYLWNLERAAGEVGTNAAGTMHPAARDAARKVIGETSVQRLETLAGLITFGCNIPLFLPPVAPYECVRFPRPGLRAELKAAARWLNVYDRYDVLGYPLDGLWDEGHGTIIEDLALEVGPPGLSLTPLAHSFYWTDSGFQLRVGRELQMVLEAGRR